MRRLAPLLLRLVCVVLATPLPGIDNGVAPAHAEGASGVVRDVGVQLRWSYEGGSSEVNGGLGRLTFEISDEASSTPLRYAPGQLAAWLQRQRPTLSEGELSCIDRLKPLVSMGIGRRADVDLNSYRILSLNADGTLAFINPFVGLNNAKLESIVVLPGVPHAWVHVPARAELWVLLDAAPMRLVIIDTHRRQVARTIDLPGNAEGATLARDEAAARAWVALPAAGLVAVLDMAAPASQWQTATAPGVRRIESIATPDGAVIFSTHTDGRLLRWGVADVADAPRVLRSWGLPQPVRHLAFSPLARRLVGHDDEALLAIDLDGSEVRRLAFGHPLADLAIADEGRYAIVVGGDRMDMVDLASGVVHARSATVPDARRLVLTRRFVYAVAGDEARADLWSLADLRAGRVQPARVLLGSASAVPAGDASLRRAIVAPGSGGLLVANPSDRLIYQYSEGMMAPIGSYSNYKRQPLAIDLLDLAPREVAPGRYEVPVRYEAGGVHHLIVSGAGPRFVACDRVALPLVSGQARRESVPELKARLVEDTLLAGERRRIVVDLSQQPRQGSSEPVIRVSDLTLLLFDKRTGWQRRVHLRELGEVTGQYVAEIEVPQGLDYEMFVSSVARDLPFVRGRVADASEVRP